MSMEVPDWANAIPSTPGVHSEPATSDEWQNLSDDQIKALRSRLIQSIIQVVVQAITGVLDPTGGLSGALGQLSSWAQNIPFLGDILDFIKDETGVDLSTVFDGIDLSSPGGVLNAIETLGGSLIQVIQGIFGVTAGSDPLADLTELGSKLMSMLGLPDFNLGGSFDPIAAAEQQLQNVLTPAGALSSWTDLPAHLLAELGVGRASSNLLPSGSFDDPSVVSGTSGWTYDATKGHTTNGSIWTTGSGIPRQMIGVAIGTKPDAVTMMSCWTKWNTVTATAGAAICLCANAYSDDAATTLISDPTNRVLAKITTPGSSSAGFAAVSADGASAADGAGWVQLSGQYKAPAGTVRVRMVLEIESVVNAGNVGFDDCVQTIQTGILDASLFTNIENIPQLLGTSVGGFLGITDLIATFQNYTDGLGSAFTQDTSLSGVDLPTLFSLAQNQTNNSITALFQAALHTLILGNRTNKSAGFGANPTSQASLTQDAYSNNGTLTTMSVAAGNAVGHRFTVPEFATYGFLELQVFGTSLTNVFANIYKIDPVTNVKTALFNSANIASLIGTTNSHVRVLLPGMPQVQASDELLFEIVNNGSNALTCVYSPTAIINNTNEVIQNTGWTRTVAAGGASPASLTSGQGSYSGNVAYAVIGIADVPANYHPPEPSKYTVAGTTVLPCPAWMEAGDLIDNIGIGGGGAGGSSLAWLSGQGGGAAIWGASTLIYGTDVKIGSSLTLVVGGRGTPSSGNSGSTPGVNGNGNFGGDTTITYTDPSNVAHTITFSGGQWGGWGPNHNGANSNTGSGGQAADNKTWPTSGGKTYFGGAAVSSGSTGQSPGAGGGGAIPYLEGASGGVGEIDLVFRQP